MGTSLWAINASYWVIFVYFYGIPYQLFMHTISGLVVKRLREKRQGDFEIHARFTVEMFAEKRWCFTTCALFMLCLRRHYASCCPKFTRYEYNHKLSAPNTWTLHGKSIQPRWSSNIFNDKGSSSILDEPEPGFDFNDEEMKKLKIWPNGAIPYYIDEFSFDKVLRDRIRGFLDATNSVTGLNFLELHRPPGEDETRWVFFVNRQGVLNCVDHPFKDFTSEGVQKILLGYDCLSGGGLASVLLALVGVPPQHNAPDRNKYIGIKKENIMPGKEYLFEIMQDNEWLFHEIDYDFTSAGHYNLHKYTVNGKATIEPSDAVRENIGEGKGFSYTDILKIRMIYNYISKKHLKSVNMPDCNKLFNIGTKINNFERDLEKDVSPRKKPNKYLGLADEKPIDEPNDNSTAPNADKEVNIEENNKKFHAERHNVEKEVSKTDKSKKKLKSKFSSTSTEDSSSSSSSISSD